MLTGYPIGKPITLTRADIGWIGVQSDTAIASFVGGVLYVLEMSYGFTAQWYFDSGWLEPVHKQWPSDGVVVDCAAQFWPSGVPGTCGWDWLLWRERPGTAAGFVITYGLPADGIQVFDIGQVPSSNIYDNPLPDP